jgi:ribosomal-protein-alanine N-acetyltransferase
LPLLETERLLLIPATVEVLRCDLESRAALAAALDAEVPESWPPDLYDRAAIEWSIEAYRTGQISPDWGVYYFAERPRPGGLPRLVGLSGFKGKPDARGTVEIGYGVLPEFRRRGYAREAVGAMLRWAFTLPEVERVIAHTLKDLAPSIGVLTSSGFTFVGAGCDPSEPDAIQYELRRVDFEKTKRDV